MVAPGRCKAAVLRLSRRRSRGVEAIVAPLGAQGFVLSATAHDGPLFHAAFERRASATPMAYVVVRNRGRSTGMDLVQKDAAMTEGLRRVVPMALDHALVELGTEASPPGALA